MGKKGKTVYATMDKAGVGPATALRVASEFVERHPILTVVVSNPPYNEYHKLCEEVEVIIDGKRGLVQVCGWTTWNHNITVEIKEQRNDHHHR